MARQVNNYQDLQDAIRDYLNRNDLTDQIELFIFLAERKIFRWYRNANNEKLVTIDGRVSPSTAPGSTEVLVAPQIDLPADYLETLTLQAFPWDASKAGATLPEKNIGRPLERISIDQYNKRRFRQNRSGSSLQREPDSFVRIRDAIYLYPEPEADLYITWQYYCDLSGLFDTPTSDNNVLKTAPDLYIYGALLEAEPFLKPEDAAFARIPIWKAMYEEAKLAINDQSREELFSGSVTEVQNGFGGYSTERRDRDGWA